MLQKQFAKMLDGFSYAYLGLKKTHEHQVFYEGGLDKLLEETDTRDPYKFFANPGTVPEIKMGKVSKRPGYSIKEFTFKSFIETPHPENNIVYCRFYQIAGKPKAPTVIVLHGWQMESYAFFDYYCRLLVREGFNAVLVDLPYHIRRKAKGAHHGEFTFSDDAVLTVKVMQQSVADIQGTLNWLKSRGVERVGIYGVSYGGMLTGLTGCVDPSVDFMMLVVPPANLYEFFCDTRLGKEFVKRNPRMFEEVEKHRDLFENISIDNLKPQMHPEKIFIVMAEYDSMVSPEALDRLWRAWERPHFERYVHGHLSVILFNPSMSRHMTRWLKTVLEDN